MASLYLVESLDGVRAGDAVRLDGSDGRHAVTVARVRTGERLRIADGRGLVVTGMVTSIDGNALVLTVDAVGTEFPSVPALMLVQALAKGGRDEMAVQASTEIGVDAIIPWAAARSVSRWEGAKRAKGTARWAAIAREAAKQSIRARVPEIAEPVTTKQLAADTEHALHRVVLVLDPTASTALSAIEIPADTDAIAVVVGPEGGTEPAELELLERAGAVRVRLGKTVLRTSTAGPVALAVLQSRLGRW